MQSSRSHKRGVLQPLCRIAAERMSAHHPLAPLQGADLSFEEVNACRTRLLTSSVVGHLEQAYV
jgi:hypothetical protein